MIMALTHLELDLPESPATMAKTVTIAAPRGHSNAVDVTIRYDDLYFAPFTCSLSGGDIDALVATLTLARRMLP
jgi:hypothetical protein